MKEEDSMILWISKRLEIDYFIIICPENFK